MSEAERLAELALELIEGTEIRHAQAACWQPISRGAEAWLRELVPRASSAS